MLDRLSDVFFLPCGWILGSKTEVKSRKICPKGGPKTKTAIFRKSCSRVHGSTIFEVRRPRKLSRNLRKTVTERRRKPKRVSGVHFHDFGAVLDPPGPPKRTLKTPQIRKMTSLDARSFPGTPNWRARAFLGPQIGGPKPPLDTKLEAQSILKPEQSNLF